jgi:hypothetical protein
VAALPLRIKRAAAAARLGERDEPLGVNGSMGSSIPFSMNVDVSGGEVGDEPEPEHERGVASCTPSVALGEDGAAEDPRDDRSDGATAWMLVACTGRGAASSVARHYRPLDDDMEAVQGGL